MSRTPPSDPTELDLVPIMNLVTILIPFLLLSASFVSLSAIDSTLPAIAPTRAEPPPWEPALNLRVAVTSDGYALSAELPLDGVDTDLPRTQWGDPADSWPADALADRLALVKAAYPSEDTLILEPTGEVPYEVLIATMDAARGPSDATLFPSVVMAGGR